MTVKLVRGAFEPWRQMMDHQERRLAPGSYGAVASFVGTMRDFNAGSRVETLFLDHYPGMTERELEKIVTEAAGRWDFLDALVIHRVGEIRPGEPIVLVAVWSAHRGPAFDACRWIMESLKQRAPFWKKESGPAGTRWVEGNSRGY